MLPSFKTSEYLNDVEARRHHVRGGFVVEKQ
jgi:hypothetical protein